MECIEIAPLPHMPTLQSFITLSHSNGVLLFDSKRLFHVGKFPELSTEHGAYSSVSFSKFLAASVTKHVSMPTACVILTQHGVWCLDYIKCKAHLQCHQANKPF